LIRSKRGVTPTEAGNILYKHATTILRQCEQAHSAVNCAGQPLTGQVSVGLALGSVSSRLAMPLLQAVREQYPGILLYLNENFPSTLNELVAAGRMDMAVINGVSARHPLSLKISTTQPLSATAQAVYKTLQGLLEEESNQVAEPLLAVG
jgi:LysR family nitrogen assimilation transcriptional regulator